MNEYYTVAINNGKLDNFGDLLIYLTLICRFTPTLDSLCDLNESAEESRIEENTATAEIHR